MPHDKKDDILNHYFLENLLFIAANSFVIWKEKGQIQDYKYLTSRLNKDTFFKREFIFYEKFAPANI